MRRLVARTGAILTTGALVAGMVVSSASLASADPGRASGTRAVFHRAAVSADSQQRVSDYWTPSRMRDAIPMDRLVRGRTAKQPSRAVAKGAPQIIAPTSPSGQAVTPQSFPNGGGAWTGGGAVVKTAGRVFFTFNGQNASCSGNAVSSGNKSTVITAGHCVKYQGSWHTNWAFVPAYDNGSEPYGKWTAKSTMSTPQWVASEDINYDVGAAVVNQLNGQSLTDVVGAQGIGFNQARRQAMYSFGYPAADPYDGTKLIYCSGTVFDDFFLSNDLAMACDMTGGSSGGPWFLTFNEGSGTGILNSVNSFGYTFLPGYMFGPYFGAEAQELYNRAQAG